MKNRIFLAAPISGFTTEEEYREYRAEILKLISYLQSNGFEIFSELINVGGAEDYDSPADSVKKDFDAVRSNDIFLMLHPARMQTSSLIELGYACAFQKRIIIAGRRQDLPYMAIGYEEYSEDADIVEIERLSDVEFPKILNALKNII